MKHPLRTPHVLAVAAAVAAVSLAPAATASAQPYPTHERTKMTFSTPVEVPNAVLQPGTYWFQLVDSQTDRHIVRIMNEDESKVITTAHAIPIERTLDKVKGDTVLALNPTEANAVGALDAWFFPGQIYGHEFIYPQKQAEQIASHTRMSILADENGKTYRLMPSGERELWVASENNKDAWEKMHEAELSSKDNKAVATSGTAKADARRSKNDDSMSAKDRVKALEEIVNNALKGTGNTVTLDRATLMDMRAQLDGLQKALDKK